MKIKYIYGFGIESNKLKSLVYKSDQSKVDMLLIC